MIWLSISRRSPRPAIFGRYRGYLKTDSPEPITINVTASNRFTVVANSRVVGTEPKAESGWTTAVTTKSGVNLVEVHYQNPAFTARRLAIRLTDKDGQDLGPQLRPFYATGRHEMTSAAAALALAGSDGLMLLLIAWLFLERCAATWRAAPAMWRAAIPIGGALFAIALFHHWSPDAPQPVIFIQSGNDGLAYESYAREALLDGWLLNSGPLHGSRCFTRSAITTG